MVLGFGRVFDNGPHLFLGAVAELVERAINRSIGGDLGFQQPLAVNTAKEVVLRPNAGLKMFLFKTGFRSGLCGNDHVEAQEYPRQPRRFWSSCHMTSLIRVLSGVEEVTCI